MKKIIIYELKAFLKSHKRIFYTMVFPMLLFGLMAAIFYNGVPRDLPVLYVDYDQSPLSSKLVRYLDATPSIKMDKVVSSETEAKKLIQKGKAYGFVLIPKNFQQDIFKGLSTTAYCYTNNQYLLPAGLIQKSFRVVVGTFSAGIKIKRETQVNTQEHKAITEVQPILTDVHTLYNPYANYAFYLLTALFPMLLQMVVMMVTIFIIGREFKNKTHKQWLERSGNRPLRALFSKMLPYTLCLFFVSWWMNYLLFKLIGVPLKTGMLNVVLMSFLLVVIYQLIAVVFVSISKDLRGALTLGSGFTATALSFAAYTYPIEGLPKSMQYLAKIFPFTHYMEYFVNRAIKNIPISYTLESIIVLSLFVLVFVLVFPKFVKLIKSEGYEYN